MKSTIKKVRPEVLSGITHIVKTNCGKMYVTVNEIDSEPFEVFVNIGKAGGCASSQTEAIGRLVSYALRTNGDIQDIIKELSGIHCHNSNGEVTSCADGVAKVFKMLYPKKED